MRVEICIPAYNEAAIIAESVRTVLASLPQSPDVTWQITVAENGSTDATADIVRALRLPNVSVLSVDTRGKGAAIVAAARVSSADIFGFIDADLSADPHCIADLLRAIEQGADVAIGSRLSDPSRVERKPLRTLSSLIFNLLRRLLLGLAVADSQCGLKFANRRGLAELAACQETGWFFDVEWLARAQREGLSIVETPIVWKEFYFPNRPSKLRVVQDGVRAMVAFLRIRRRLRQESRQPRYASVAQKL